MTKAKQPKRQPGQPKRGPLPWEPTRDQRLMIELAAANGFTRPQIAALVNQSEDTLLKYCRAELETADIKAGVKISGALFTKAMKGDTTALIWWEKTRRGMKDTSRTEHTGKNGEPIEYRSLSDEEIDARIAAVIAGHDGSGVTTH